jgi:thiamine pyrophosphokinase
MDADHPRVLGVLAGADMPLPRLAEWARSAEVVLAADGGGDRLLEVGITPQTTIGDMDSTQSVLPFRRIIRDPDQETSDCDKLLTLAERTGYRRISLIGVEGDRLDHVLATLGSGARSPLEVRLILRRGLAWSLRGPIEIEIDTLEGELLSLLPLEECSGVTLTGVRWPLQGAELSATRFVSLSNRASASRVRLEMTRGAAALIVTSDRLEAPSW